MLAAIKTLLLNTLFFKKSSSALLLHSLSDTFMGDFMGEHGRPVLRTLREVKICNF